MRPQIEIHTKRRGLLLLLLLLSFSVFSHNSDSTDHPQEWILQTNIVRPFIGDFDIGLLNTDDNRDILVYGSYVAPYGIGGNYNYHFPWYDNTGFGFGFQYRKRYNKRNKIRERKDYKQHLDYNTRFRNQLRNRNYFWGLYFEYYAVSAVESEYYRSDLYNYYIPKSEINSSIPVPPGRSSNETYSIGFLSGLPIVNRSKIYSDIYIGIGATYQDFVFSGPKINGNPYSVPWYYDGETLNQSFLGVVLQPKLAINFGIKI